MQAHWRGHRCRKLLRQGWLRQLQFCLGSIGAVDILAVSNPVLPLFHRVFRADCLEDLPILSRITAALVSAIMCKGRNETDVGRAIFYTVKTSSAILRAIEAQRYTNSTVPLRLFMSCSTSSTSENVSLLLQQIDIIYNFGH